MAVPGLAVASTRQAGAAQAANDAGQIGNAAARPEKTVTRKAVPTISELDARALAQRQQIAAALYDRSFSFGEGVKALKRQDAIQAYASAVVTQEGGPTDKDLRTLDRKLDRAEAQIGRLTTNARGADLDSDAAVDGSAIDTVQANLAARIAAGLKDGTLTREEADTLLARQQEIADAETKLRESGGLLTAAEQKEVLDQLRKTADQINAARRNDIGVKYPVPTYAENIDKRQAALEKQLEQGLKAGSLTAEEADAVLAEFQAAAEAETQALANGKIDWREYVGVSNALNLAEIRLYELQRNTDGKQLADRFVDQKYVDQRQSQQLESLTRGIDNGRLTNEEAATLLESQQAIDQLQAQYADGGMTRAEYLRLQIEMNNFSIQNSDAQVNAARWTGLFSAPAAQNPASTPEPGTAPAASGPVPGTAGGNVAAASASSNAGASDAGASGGTPGTGASSASESTAGGTPATSATPAAGKQETAAAPSQPGPGVATVLKALEEIKDIFGELVNGMLKTHNSGTKELHDRFAERIHARIEDEPQRSEKKSIGQAEPGPGAPRNAEDERKFGTYAVNAVANERPEAAVIKKIA